MRLPAFLQPRVLAQVVRAVLSPPFTTRFPATPFEPMASFRGRPRYDEAGCIGCGACAEVCPAKCIEFFDDTTATPPLRRLVQHLDACLWCGQCARYCPTGRGIVMSNEYDAVGFTPEDFEERVEKQLALCEVCGGVIAPVDQLRWLADRLGPIAFANPTLMAITGSDLGLCGGPMAPHRDDMTRSDRLALQCPRCRRRTAFSA